jgi:hypothetical protein
VGVINSGGYLTLAAAFMTTVGMILVPASWIPIRYGVSVHLLGWAGLGWAGLLGLAVTHDRRTTQRLPLWPSWAWRAAPGRFVLAMLVQAVTTGHRVLSASPGIGAPDVQGVPTASGQPSGPSARAIR